MIIAPKCGLIRKRRIFVRRAAVCLALALLPWHLSASGQVIENPAHPKSTDAGRTITPKEILAISDEGRGDYYFKWPYNLRVAPDGSIFVMDDKQFVQFDKDGRFQRNLFKSGQGPGEMGYMGGYFLTAKNIIALANSPEKLLWFDYAGTYEREAPVRAEQGAFLRPLFFLNGTFYFHCSQVPLIKGEPGMLEVSQTIAKLIEGAGEPKMLASFPTRACVVSDSGRAMGMISLSSLVAVPYRQKYLALFRTSEYLLKIYDPETNAVRKEFRRVYERVKQAPQKDEQKKSRVILNGKTYTAPDQKYANDITNILARGGDLWVVTSTRDKAQGILVDVFDGDGVYQDSFYVKLPEAALNSLASPSLSTLEGDFCTSSKRTRTKRLSLRST